MSVENPIQTSLSIQQFTSSEPGAWSNSYLIGGKSEAILFDVFMLRWRCQPDRRWDREVREDP